LGSTGDRKMRKINKIIVHHSASNGKTTTPEDIWDWHKSKGYKLIGYHYLVDYDGILHQGRDENMVGAHCKGKNLNSLGVCVIGNFQIDFPSKKQAEKLRVLLTDLKKKYPDASIEGHLENANTLCPGINLMPYLKDLRGTL
jgi:N-acetylmuramoyl-L-alanine amidase